MLISKAPRCSKAKLTWLTGSLPRTSYSIKLRSFTNTRTPPSSSPAEVQLLEVGPRDGLQNIKQFVPTPIKVELIQRLHAARLGAIEATSFVSPKWIPQLADGEEVMSKISPLSERNLSGGKLSECQATRFPVLVPNVRGFERASQNGAREIVVFASASEGFSQKNTRCSVQEALDAAAIITERALEQGIAVRGVVSCIFACPYDGPTEPAQVLKVVKKFLDMGCFEVALGDTLGVGTPADVQKLLGVLLAEVPAHKLAGHYHDTYGQAVANVVKSYDMGIRSFDSAIAGLGGCPYAKGAKGNLATEDIAYTFERAGVKTGVDLDQLVATGEWISQQLQLPNGSRAGAALYAKGHGQAKQPASPLSEVTRAWEQIEDTGEYQVLRHKHMVKIKLTRPKNGNALTTSMVDGLTSIFKRLACDSSVFHIMLTAEGKFFCTGMDLSAGGSSASTSSSVKADYYAKVVNFFKAIDNAPQTTISVIQGSCYGGGVGLAFACDIRIATAKSKFTLSEIKLGLTPAIISKYLMREWGPSFGREAMLTGREIDVMELSRIGSIHQVAETSDTIEAAAEAYLEKISLSAPQAASEIKELVRLAWCDPAGNEQEQRIAKAFAEMMAPGSEGEHGLRQFRNKIKKVDWNAFHSGRAVESKA